MSEPSNLDPDLMLVLGRVLGLSEAAGGVAVSHAAVIDASGDVDAAALHEAVRALDEKQYVRIDERFSGAWLATPTSAGRRAWDEFEQARQSPRARRRHMRDEYLMWLYDQHEDGRSPTADEFLDSGAAFQGSAYTLEDLERTGEWLLEREFIKGPMVWGRADPIRPQITAKGEYYVEGNHSVHETPAVAGNTTFNNTIHGPAMLAQNSDNITQTQNINGWKDDALSLADAVLQLAATMPENAKLADIAVALKDEVQSEGRPAKVREFVDNLAKALATGAGGALGGMLVTQAGALVASLPL